VPHKTTYYSETELAVLESLEEERDSSFSGVVREAIQEYYEINDE